MLHEAYKKIGPVKKKSVSINKKENWRKLDTYILRKRAQKKELKNIVAGKPQRHIDVHRCKKHILNMSNPRG